MNIRVSPIFEANRRALFDKGYRIALNQGSSNSGKTYNIIFLLIMICINPERFGFSVNEKMTISIVSQSLPHLRKGAIKDFLKIMAENPILNFTDKNWNRSNHVYTFPNGSYIEFTSFETPGAARGPRRKILYINEANTVSREICIQLFLRTEHKILLDYNPVDLYSWLYDEIKTRSDCKFIHSTYLDNKPFLLPEQIQEMERLKDLGGDFWNIYGLGILGTGEGRIYNNWERFEVYPAKTDETIYGIDFGFNHPMVLLEARLCDEIPYINTLVYESGLITANLISKMNDLGISKSADIYCDNAEPDRIEEICQAGYNALPAEKDVEAGIDYCQKLPLKIHFQSELIKEIQMYQWKKDKNDKLLDEPVKAYDDGMDAMRYALYTHSKQTEFHIWRM